MALDLTSNMSKFWGEMIMYLPKVKGRGVLRDLFSMQIPLVPAASVEQFFLGEACLRDCTRKMPKFVAYTCLTLFQTKCLLLWDFYLGLQIGWIS